MKNRHDNAPKGGELKNTDFLVWAVSRDKKLQHDREITRLYNRRARQTPETKH